MGAIKSGAKRRKSFKGSRLAATSDLNRRRNLNVIHMQAALLRSFFPFKDPFKTL